MLAVGGNRWEMVVLGMVWLEIGWEKTDAEIFLSWSVSELYSEQ